MPHSVTANKGRIAIAHGSQVILFQNGVEKAIYDVPESNITHERDQRPNYIGNLGFANDGRIIGLDHFSKSLDVFESDTLKVLSQRQFPKRPSAWSIAPDGWLLVGDKFGDVYKIPLDSTDALIDESGQTIIEPILGHVSMLLDVAATSTSVLTSDRDEHIRVSAYPNAYQIERFLWGHHEYVAFLGVIGDYVVSGGGDNFIMCTNWRTGEHKELDLGQEEVDLAFIKTAGDKCLVAVENVPQLWLVDVPSLETKVVETPQPPIDACVSDDQLYVAFANELQAAPLGEPTKMELIKQFPADTVHLSNALLRKRPRSGH